MSGVVEETIAGVRVVKGFGSEQLQVERLEAEADSVLDRALKGIRGPVALGPSCGLEFLPRARAQAKLENMVALAREYAGHDGRNR